MRICAKCRREYSDCERYCSKCGTRLRRKVKFEPGDEVVVKGTISRVEMWDDCIASYVREAPEIPIPEEDLSRRPSKDESIN